MNKKHVDLIICKRCVAIISRACRENNYAYIGM